MHNRIDQCGDRTSGDEFAIFEMSKISGFLEIAFEFLTGFALLAIASYVVGDVKGFGLWFGLLAMYGAAGIAFSRVLFRLRYRYILGIRYVVGADGIAVEEDGTKERFNWSDFSRAEFLRLTPTYRLWVAGQSRPIVLIAVGGLPGGRLDRRNKLAESFLKQNLGTRLKTSWLPW
jgi:hypothetical protein